MRKYLLLIGLFCFTLHAQVVKTSVRHVQFVDAGGFTAEYQAFLDAMDVDPVGDTAIAQDVQVDLMPEEVLMQRSLEDQGRELLKVATAGFIILFLVALTLGLRIYFKTTYLNNLKTISIQYRFKIRNSMIFFLLDF